MKLVWYQNFGYNDMQNWVANTILRRKTQVQGAHIVQTSRPMNFEVRELDEYPEMMQLNFASFIFLMYIPLVYRSV